MHFKSIREHLVSDNRRPVIVCLASYFKGGRFMEAARASGAYVILITKEKLRYEPWPFASIDEFHAMPDLKKEPDITYGVSYLARGHEVDAVVALDEYDALVAADLREHLRLRGFGHSQARFFRDKLAMRTQASRSRIRMPRFVQVLNHGRIAEFLETVPAPWVMKPRMEASAMGIRKLSRADEVWARIEELGDEQSRFLLEEFVEGDVYHVDSVVTAGKVVFSAPSRYETPPLNIYQGGGVFQTTTVDRESKEAAGLAKLNKRLLKAFGLKDGVAHAEFIKRHDDGKLYFLEVAARVGGAGIDQLVEAAYGINLWEEWARNVVLPLRGETYALPEERSGYAGLIVCLSKVEHPDMSMFGGGEVFWRLEKPHHAGVVIRSSSRDQLEGLLSEYRERFAREFLATQPPLEKADD